MSIHTLDTEDKLEYQFFPVTKSQLQFRVQAPNDAHIALTTTPFEGEPMYEVFIGGWKNTKSVIRKNRTKPEVAEVETPGILSNDESRGFWIRWCENTITVGKEGIHDPILTYTDPEPITVAYIGVCTGWGASGEWQLEGYQSLTTQNNLQYKFYAAPGALFMKIKAKSNAHIALTNTKGESSPMYEVILGGWENTASVIRYDRKQPDKVRKDTPNLLHSEQFRRFTICWIDGHIMVRAGDQIGPLLLDWKDTKPIGITHVGVRTGWGATGKWDLRFDHPFRVEKRSDMLGAPTPTAPLGTGSAGLWCDVVGGIIPPGAVEGGRDVDGPLYVGRAKHVGDSFIPGKVNPSHGVCYIPWGGEEIGKSEYQVLCGCPSTWVPTSGGIIPPNAIPAGQTEDDEVLYVGRANHEGTVTLGKVQPSHKVLYIPFAGQEVAFPEYEILVS